MAVSDLMVVVPWAVFAVAAIAAGIMLTRPRHESRRLVAGTRARRRRPGDGPGYHFDPQSQHKEHADPEDRPTARAP